MLRIWQRLGAAFIALGVIAGPPGKALADDPKPVDKFFPKTDDKPKSVDEKPKSDDRPKTSDEKPKAAEEPKKPSAVAIPLSRREAARPGIIASAAPTSTIFTDLADPAFDRYVDLRALGAAWAGLDPAALTDVALQLAEGERILLRPHKAVSAAKLLETALKVASDKRDNATLERLARAAERIGNKDLAGRVAGAQALAKDVRAVDPALSVSIDEMTPEGLARFKAYRDAIGQARLKGDRDRLTTLQTGVDKLKDIGDGQKEYLKKQIAEAAKKLPEKADPQAEMLNKLGASSRDYWGDLAQKGRDVGGRVSRQAHETGGQIAQQVKNTGGHIAQQAKQTGGQIAQQAKNTGGHIAQQAKSTGGHIAQQAKQTGGQIAQQAKNTAGHIAQQAKKIGGDIAREAKHAGGDIAREAKRAGGDVAREGKKAGGDIARTVHDAGRHLPDLRIPVKQNVTRITDPDDGNDRPNSGLQPYYPSNNNYPNKPKGGGVIIDDPYPQASPIPVTPSNPGNEPLDDDIPMVENNTPSTDNPSDNPEPDQPNTDPSGQGDNNRQAEQPELDTFDERQLAIQNDTGDRVQVYVRYNAKNDNDQWEWFPAAPSEDAEWAGPFTVEAGQTIALKDGDTIIGGRTAQIRAESDSGSKWGPFNVEMVRGTYQARDFETFTFRIYNGE